MVTILYVMASCCLCDRELETGLEKKKRRLLNGRSCVTVKEFLETVLQENNILYADISKFCSDDAYICHKCKCAIEELLTVLKRASSLKDELWQLISHATISEMPVHHSQPHLSSARKRPASSSAISHFETSDDHIYNLSPSITTIQEQGNDNDEASTPKRSRQTIQRPSTNQSRVLLSILHPSGTRNIPVDSPWRQENIKRVAQGRYNALSSSIAGSSRTEDLVMAEVVQRIKQEIKAICSETHDSILRDSHEALKRFSWETVWLELLGKTPMLIKLLSGLIGSPDVKGNKPLTCLIASMLIKKRLSKLSLVQKIITIFLYGNGTHKKVYAALQPLMLTMSKTSVINMIDNVSSDYDQRVHEWCDNQCDCLTEKTHVGCDARTTTGTIGDQESREVENEDDYQESGSVNNEPTDSDTFCSDSLMASIMEELQLSDENECDYVDNDERFDNSGDTEVLVSCSSLNHTPTDLVAVDQSVPVTQTTTTTSQPINIPSPSSHTCCSSTTSSWKGFKLVGDNIDKNVHRSFQRLHHNTLSLHYFHTYAVLDRVDFSGLSDEPPPSGEIDFTRLLPSTDDIQQLKKYLVVLVSRALKVYWKPEKQFSDSGNIQWHIPHKYSNEMSTLSTCVPVGVQLHNENKVDEMCSIMEELQKYCPIVPSTRSATEDSSESALKCWEVLFGGDQLTRVRAVSAIRSRAGHDDLKEQLTSFIPVVEDWHTRLTLMKVIWLSLFSSKSAKEKGTLYQMRNLLNRSSVPTDPSHNMKSAEDFLNCVLVAHIVTAADTVTMEESSTSLLDIATKIVEQFVHISMFSEELEDSMSSEDSSVEIVDAAVEEEDTNSDGVFSYACEVLTLGLIWDCFHDATKEGDGDRVMFLWKFLLLVFKLHKRKNYSQEAAMLLLQSQYLFSPRKVAQLTWSRFVNTPGRRACNIPCDLHMEHLNHRLKEMLRHLGSNVQPNVILRARKCVGLIHNICSLFEKETEITSSGHHTTPSFQKDLNLLSGELKEAQVFIKKKNGRRHSSFKFTKPLLLEVNKDKVIDWLVENIAPKLLF